MKNVEIRPWGGFEVLYEDDTCKVKKIGVNPNSRLSYQYHNHRRECWTVTSGELTIILDDEKVFRSPGESNIEDKKLRLEKETYWIHKLNPVLNSQKVDMKQRL